MYREQEQSRIDEIRNRLDSYGEHENCSPSDVVSLKLRPMQMARAIGVQPAFEAQDYTSLIIYTDVRAQCNVTPVADTLAAKLKREAKAYWLDLDGHRLLWIENETGLEIIGAIAAIFTIGSSIYKVFNIVQRHLRDKTESDGPTPPAPAAYASTVKIRTHIEIRYYDKSGQVREERVDEQIIEQPYIPKSIPKPES